MKVLIADDERIECVALEKMISELFPALEVLPGVHDGMELLRAVEEQHPDIAIVDISMPKLNGLEALEVLSMQHNEMVMIIHTAYDEFEYLHKAMKIGVLDFLVKPVTEDHLIQVMYRAIEAVQQRQKPQQNAPAASAEMLGAVNNSVMMSLILQKPDTESYRIWQEVYQTGRGAGVIVSIEPVRGNLPDQAAEELIQSSESRCICMHYVLKERLYLYLFTEGVTDEEGYQAWLKSWLGTKIADLSIQYHCELRCGVSSCRLTVEEMADALSESDMANGSAKNRSVCFFNYEKKTQDHDISLQEEAQQLAGYLSEDGAGRTAAFLSGKIEEKNAGKDAHVSLRCGLLLARLLQETAGCLQMDLRKTGMRWSTQERVRDILRLYGMLPEEGEPEDANLKSDAGIGREKLDAYLLEVLEQMAEDLKKPVIPPGRAVENAIAYIQKNYASDISLEETAEQVGVTKFYLGRLLKQERGQNFMEILTDLRLAKALRYIEKGTATNQTISSLVGYNTVEYFQQVFKRKLGLSPGEYRRIMENENQEDR